MALGVAGGDRNFDLTVAAAANTEVVRAKLRTMEMLGLRENIEDVLITLDSQYHLIRPLTGRSRTTRPGRSPMGRRPATCRWSSGSQSGRASRRARSRSATDPALTPPRPAPV